MTSRTSLPQFRQFKLMIACLLCATIFSSSALNKPQLETSMRTQFGASGLVRLNAWGNLLQSDQDKTTREKLAITNDFFNKNIHFMEDLVVWKQTDYWATPLETLGKGAGDCEDYAIAKYFTLLNFGFAVDQLRLIYVKAQIGGPNSHIFQAHMVLGYYSTPDAIPLILDSLESTLELADKRTDLHPIFSFNSDGLWVGNNTQAQIDPSARLSRWRDLLQRMKQQGF